MTTSSTPTGTKTERSLSCKCSSRNVSCTSCPHCRKGLEAHSLLFTVEVASCGEAQSLLTLLLGAAAAAIPMPTSVDAVRLLMPPSAPALLKLLLCNLWGAEGMGGAHRKVW